MLSAWELGHGDGGWRPLTLHPPQQPPRITCPGTWPPAPRTRPCTRPTSSAATRTRRRWRTARQSSTTTSPRSRCTTTRPPPWPSAQTCCGASPLASPRWRSTTPPAREVGGRRPRAGGPREGPRRPAELTRPRGGAAGVVLSVPVACAAGTLHARPRGCPRAVCSWHTQLQGLRNSKSKAVGISGSHDLAQVLVRAQLGKPVTRGVPKTGLECRDLRLRSGRGLGAQAAAGSPTAELGSSGGAGRA